MKKLIVIAAIATLLSACGPRTEIGSDVPSEEISYTKDGNTVYVVKDDKTGCEYLVYDGYKAGGIIPRLNPDGTPKCKGANE